MEKIAILSDIHSNYEAFKACLLDLMGKEIDYIVFLGDYISDYSNPEQTMDLIYEIMKQYPCQAILGNREEYFINPNKNWKPSTKNGSLYYTYRHLRPEDKIFIQKLPRIFSLHFENRPSILFSHGSPAKTRELLYSEQENTHEWLDKIDEDILISGHTHVPFIEYWHHKMIMNPGSIGENVSQDTRATYGILSWENQQWVPSIQYVTYDYQKEQKRLLESDFVDDAFYWAAATYKNLATGRNEALLLLEEANKNATNGHPTEDDFKEAAKKLNIDPLR